MRKSKLWRIFQALTDMEVRQFKLYLESPYFLPFKRSQELQPLYHFLVKCRKKKTFDQLEKENVLTKLFPKTSFDIKKIDKLMSALLRELQHFIHLQSAELQKDSIQEVLYLSSFLRERKAYDVLDVTFNRLERIQKNKGIQDRQDYYTLFQIAEESHQQAILNNQLRGYDYEVLFRPLDIYYLLSRLEEVCSLLSLNRFIIPVNVQPFVSFLEEVKPVYQRQGLLDVGVVNVYYQTFEMLKNLEQETSQETYWKLKKLIEENEKILPSECLKSLYGLSRSFIIFQHTQGAKHLAREIFELYRTQLAKGYLNYRAGILPSTYKNIVTIGLQVKENEWVWQFIEAYKDKLEGTTHPRDVYHLNKAIYFLHVKEYDKALELLADQYDDLSYKLAARRLELESLYETNSELLDARMDAFKLLVFRLSDHLILPRNRKKNNNFVNFLRQIRNPKTIHNSSRINKLIEKIKATKYLFHREWLVERLEEMQ